MRLLGISGSLRTESSNSRLLEAATKCMPDDVSFEIASCLDQLPHFNPDLEVDSIDVVRAWVDQVRICDGIIISTPEYARGYPGSLKNALDWLVQTDAHIEKPFMLLNASSRSTVARDSLTVVLKTMSGIHIEQACITFSLLGKALSTEEMLATGDTAERIRSGLSTFVDGIRSLHKEQQTEA